MAVTYTLSIKIDKPVDQVWDFFMDGEKAYLWQPTLESIEVIKGEKGQAGSVNKMKFKSGPTSEIMETIKSVDNATHVFESEYAGPGVINLTKNMFKDNGDGTTTYEMYNEFQMQNFMMKIMGVVAKGMFKSETNKTLKAFKEAIEKQ